MNEQQTTSIWMAGFELPQYPALEQDSRVDVCVLGAGIAGLSTAYLLQRAGKSVAVIESGATLGRQTERTTAHLANALDDHYQVLRRHHGEQGARLAAASHGAAIDTIEQIAGEEQIACDFSRVDAYLYAAGDQDEAYLADELEASHQAGLTGVEWVERAPLPGINTGRALRYPDQGQFHPLKYLKGLAAAFEARGGRIYFNTHGEAIEGGDRPHVQTRAGRRIDCGAIVVATNTPVNDRLFIHTKQAPYTSYVIAAEIPEGHLPLCLIYDTPDPYHYIRLHRLDDGRWTVIVGGEDHMTGQKNDGEERFGCLESWSRERIPAMGKVLFRWSGEVHEPSDGMAYIGRNPGEDHVYIVTGDSGNGITHGMIGGILITDLILGRDNPWQELYEPSRKTPSAAGEWIKEAAKMNAPFAKWLSAGDVATPDEIPAGEGAVLRRGLTKHAVYRSPDGALHEMSAVCPHLGCIVTWNSTEKTWDCPCHGSRFGAEGDVIMGPANSGLKRVQG